jgi:ABC-2 type transport system ATP-binding protein
MEEAERCHQIAFISMGRLLTIGNPAQLKANNPGEVIEVECQPLMKASAVFEKLPGVTEITAYGTTLHLNVKNAEQVFPEIREAAARNNIQISRLEKVPAALEDVFATLSEAEDA